MADLNRGKVAAELSQEENSKTTCHLVLFPFPYNGRGLVTHSCAFLDVEGHKKGKVVYMQ